MKFTVPSLELADAVTRVAGAAKATADASVPLHGIRMTVSGEWLVLTATDLDTTITTRLGVTDTLDGAVVVPAKILGELLRSLDEGPVNVSADGDQLEITSAGATFAVTGISASLFPKVTENTAKGSVVDAQVVLGALSRVSPAASRDMSRPQLTGVNIAATETGLRLAATDSYRLAVVDVDTVGVLADGQKVTVPATALEMAKGLFRGADKLEVRFGDSTVTFASGDTRITARLIGQDFPNYSGIIPTAPVAKVSVGVERLSAALKRVRVMAREGAPVRLGFATGELVLSSVSNGTGSASEVVPATIDGEPCDIAFNPQYLVPSLAALHGDDVTFEITDGLKPVKVTDPADETILLVVMPVRV